MFKIQDKIFSLNSKHISDYIGVSVHGQEFFPLLDKVNQLRRNNVLEIYKLCLPPGHMPVQQRRHLKVNNIRDEIIYIIYILHTYFLFLLYIIYYVNLSMQTDITCNKVIPTSDIITSSWGTLLDVR